MSARDAAVDGLSESVLTKSRVKKKNNHEMRKVNAIPYHYTAPTIVRVDSEQNIFRNMRACLYKL